MSRPQHIVTIMPDYGFGPYAWQKPATDESTLVGQCIGTAVDGFETEDGTKITAALEAAFAAWTEHFERFAEKEEFDWPGFHSQGIELGRRLKRELGSNYRVSYHKPFEDPAHEVNECTEINDA